MLIILVAIPLLGTFEPEVERPRYGITKQLSTYNPLRVGFHEWWSLGHDVRHAASLRDRIGHVLRGPGWSPSNAAQLATS